MEIVIFLLGIISIFLVFFMLLDDNPSNEFISGSLGFITGAILLTVTWFALTEKVEEPVHIQTSVTEGIEWKYYTTDEGGIVPIPNIVDSVVKINQRTGSVEPPEYKLIYK